MWQKVDWILRDLKDKKSTRKSSSLAVLSEFSPYIPLPVYTRNQYNMYKLQRKVTYMIRLLQ